MIATVIGYDAMAKNEHLLPLNAMAAGYDTQAGGDIEWSAQQYARHTVPYPALHIDQDARASDFRSDYLDVETNAATDVEIVGWLTEARNSFGRALRPGQRWPGIYTSESNVDSCVRILQAAGLTDVPFIVAHYGIGQAEAVRMVATATGPYPAVGYQFNDTAFGGAADTDVWSVPWLEKVSGTGQRPPAPVTYLTATETEAIMQALPQLAQGADDTKLPHQYVRRVQGLISAVYGPVLPFDGVFGATTTGAVKAIQKGHGLTADGIVGPKTWALLVTAVA